MWSLTEAQSGLWYAQKLAPENPSFNTGHVLWLHGALDVAAFTQAANQAAQEAQALRLRFAQDADAAHGVRQWLDEAHTPWLECIDLSAEHPQPEAAEQAARAAMQADMQRPLDPMRDKLARQCLFVLGDGRWAWYQRAHHLLNDGYGMALWEGRVTALYEASLNAALNAGAEETTQTQATQTQALGDYAAVMLEAQTYHEQADDPQSKRGKDAAYWRAAFADAPEVAGMAANQSAKALAAHHCIHQRHALPAAWREALLDFARRVDIPWPDVLTALTALYCLRMAAAEQTVVGIPFMGRLGSASARVPAMVMNVLPLRVSQTLTEEANQPVDPAPSASSPAEPRATPNAQRPTLKNWLHDMARAQTRARRHGRYRSEQLRRDLGLLGGNRRLYGTLVNVQPFYQPVHIRGVQARLEILGTGPIDDLTIGFRGNASDALELEIEANPDLYDATVVAEHRQRLDAFLARAFALDPERASLGDLPLASDAEAQRYLFEVNATDHPVPQTTLVALIEAQMRRSPEAIALEYEGQSLTYTQLDARTQALAQALRAQGAGADQLVAVAMPRSLELLIALVGVLRAGAAYLPLDIHNPPDRLARIVQLAKPVCALVSANAQERPELPASLVQLPADEWPDLPLSPRERGRGEGTPVAQQPPLAQEDAARPSPPTPLPMGEGSGAISPSHLAYVIYTSGSTGEPKGVMIEHQAIVNRLEWMRQHYGFDASDRFLQKTPATFDVSVWEFFLPLLCGGTLVIAPPEAHRDPAWLARLIRQSRIGTCHFVPSMLAAFVAEPQARGIQMRRIFTSGEELPAELRDRTHTVLQTQLHNLYGPTEAAVDVSYWDAHAGDDARPVPIGFPVWNTRLYVLDAQMRPQPPGVAGDLYLGGVQLARGYLGRDDLTAAAFVADPHRSGERIYKSGDLARWRRDGALEYIGRSDHQIKLRGLRIELGEIDTALHSSGLIARGNVLVREDRPGDKKLVAYVQGRDGAEVDVAALKRHVAAQVPEYMVPAAFVVLRDWPTTANGKLDRKALPAPSLAASSGRALHTATERRLAQLFADQLGLQVGEIDADSDFFSLGGDSLSAVQLLLAVQEEWQRSPGLGALFASPTVGAFAALIDDEEVAFDSGLAPLISLAHPAGSASSPAADDDDAPLFVIHPAGGICWGYRHLARALAQGAQGKQTQGKQTQGRGRAVYGLQSPALDPAQPLPESIDALARQYVQRVREVQPGGCVHLLGWSVGGIIAQAMAVEMQQQAAAAAEKPHDTPLVPGLVALLDAYPADVWRAEPEPTPIQALRALLAIAGYDPEGHPELDTQDKLVAFLRQGQTALGHLPDAALEGVVRVVTDTNRLIRNHHHRRYEGRLTHIRAGRDHSGKPHLQSSLWAPYAGELIAHEVPFLHAELTGAAATAAMVPLLFNQN